MTCILRDKECLKKGVSSGARRNALHKIEWTKIYRNILLLRVINKIIAINEKINLREKNNEFLILFCVLE